MSGAGDAGPRVAALVLAAGGSRRLGRPKQLLPFAGRTLIVRAVETALASRAREVFVVLGADAARVAAEIETLPCRRIPNPEWATGLSSSIRRGVEAVAASPADAVLLLLVDQPCVTPVHLDQLIDAAAERGSSAIAACEYEGRLGVPALFGRGHFDALRHLEGDRGARALLARRRASVRRVPCQEAALDVDTQVDYERLRRLEPGCDDEGEAVPGGAASGRYWKK